MELNKLFKPSNQLKDQFEVEQEGVTKVESLLDYGRNEAIESKGNLEMFNICLQKIETGHIVKKTDITRTQETEIEQKKKLIKSIELDIDDKMSEIKTITESTIPKQKVKIENNKVEFNKLYKQSPRDYCDTRELYRPHVFYVLLFFVIALTFSLYYFYVNLGYVLFDLPSVMGPEMAFTCSPTVLNSFSQLIGEGGCNTSAGLGSFVLPILFLAIAALIHMKNENLLLNKELKGYATVGFFLLLVLALDVMLAVLFEARLFSWNGTGGIYGEQFPSRIIDQIKYCANQPSFLIILGFGFMSYVVWSFLIFELLKELEKKNPEIVHRRKLRMLVEEKERLELEIDSLELKKDEIIPDKIRVLRKEINKIRETIKLINVGGINELKNSVIEFSIGWNKFLIFRHSDSKLDKEQLELKNTLKTFFESSNLFNGKFKDEELKLI